MKTHIKRLSRYRPIAEIFAYCHNWPQAVFLDSSLSNELGRYSIIALDPCVTYSFEKGVAYRDKKPLNISFEEALRKHLDEFAEENDTSLPLISGAIGYFTYDYGRLFENTASRHTSRIDIPDAVFVFYHTFLIEDHSEKELYLCSKGESLETRKTAEHIKQWVQDTPHFKEKPPQKSNRQASFVANFEKEEYKESIDRLVQYIIEGDVYIANLTQQLTIKSKKSPYEIFSHLRVHNPSPFGSYLNYGTFQVISASPERFLHMKQQLIETRPVKGTRKRGATPEEDNKLYEELRKSSKDRSELLMVVDLLRNDLNRVCDPGSVKVVEHFKVEAYATVFHLVTTIIGKLSSQYDVFDLLAASFPGGSITGTPKIRAMEIIDELEHSARGLYTGSVGYIGLDGSCDLNIVIRTAIHEEGIYHLGVGSGITGESERDFEYEETLQKAKALLEALYDGSNGRTDNDGINVDGKN